MTKNPNIGSSCPVTPVIYDKLILFNKYLYNFDY